MKRILYLGGFNLPDRNAAAQRVIANAKILRTLDFEVVLVGLSPSIMEKESFDFHGFECVNLPYPKGIGGWVQMLTSIKQYVPYITKDTYAVIAYNHPAIALKKLLEFNKRYGIKTISDCTEWYEPQGGFIFRLIKGWDVKQRMEVVHSKLDGVITISKYLDDYYKSKNVKTILLPPLVDKKDAKWSAAIKGECDSISLLYAGSPGGTKDRLDFVIEALDKIYMQGYSFKLDIVGITEEVYRKVYLKGEEKPIPSFVHFWGRIPHQEVINKLRESDFQVFLREDHLANKAGFPTKFAETISAGTIVLTNASSNLKDYMVEGENSFEINICDEDHLFNSLLKPLSLSKAKIKDIKENIDTDLFDYRHYINKMSCFLKAI